MDAHFDGDLPLDALTAAERRAVEAITAAAAAARQQQPAAAPDFAHGVLRRIEELGLMPAPAAQPVVAPDRPRGRLERAFGGLVAGVVAPLWRPRQMTFRPAYALALAAFAAVVLVRGAGFDAPQPTALQAHSAAPMYVQFQLQAESAQSVALAGSFSEWQPRYELVQSRPGVWTLMVALPPGVHDYAFLVDGEEWVADPVAPTVDDGFGGRNSRLALLPAGEVDL
jgi:hypothetical protein